MYSARDTSGLDIAVFSFVGFRRHLVVALAWAIIGLIPTVASAERGGLLKGTVRSLRIGAQRLGKVVRASWAFSKAKKIRRDELARGRYPEKQLLLDLVVEGERAQHDANLRSLGQWAASTEAGQVGGGLVAGLKDTKHAVEQRPALLVGGILGTAALGVVGELLHIQTSVHYTLVGATVLVAGAEAVQSLRRSRGRRPGYRMGHALVGPLIGLASIGAGNAMRGLSLAPHSGASCLPSKGICSRAASLVLSALSAALTASDVPLNALTTFSGEH